MENIQKNVTAKDIAAAVGCSLKSVHLVLAKNINHRNRISAELEAKILQAARSLGYDPALAHRYGGKIGMENRWGSFPNMKAVAEKAGCSVSTVSRCFAGGKISIEVKERILKTAQEIGFVYRPSTKDPEERKARRAAKAKAEKERKFSLRYAGFKNAEEQNEYMMAMRSMGFSNAQICRKVGLTIQTVRCRIGSQPNDLTKENRVAGQKHRAAENHRRKVYVDTHLVTEYNALITQCVELRTQAAELITKSDELAKTIKEMQPKIEKASLTTVKPAQFPPEQLSMLNMAPSTPIQ